MSQIARTGTNRKDRIWPQMTNTLKICSKMNCFVQKRGLQAPAACLPTTTCKKPIPNYTFLTKNDKHAKNTLRNELFCSKARSSSACGVSQDIPQLPIFDQKWLTPWKYSQKWIILFKSEVFERLRRSQDIPQIIKMGLKRRVFEIWDLLQDQFFTLSPILIELRPNSAQKWSKS